MRRLRLRTVNWTLIAYAVVLCVGIWSAALDRVQRDYRSTLETERERLRSVSGTLQAQVEAMLGDGVGAALAAANELGSRSDLAHASDAQFADTLAHMLTGGSYVRSLFLANTKRFVRVGRSELPDIRTTPPAWLAPALVLDSDSAWVGGPIPDPDDPAEQVIPVARRVEHGMLLNDWAGALIAFRSLEGAYRQTDSASVVGLFSADGTALMVVTQDAQVRAAEGTNVHNSSLFQQAERGPDSGVMEGISPLADVQTIVAYDRVRGYPLFAVASRRREETLTPWYGRRRGTVEAAAGISALVIGTTWLLNYFVGALRRREHHYRTLFNNASFGAFVLDGEHIAEANRTSAAMFGVSGPRELIGMRLWDLSPSSQPGGASSEEFCRARIRQMVDSGATTFEWTQQRLDTHAPFFAAVYLSSLDVDGTTLMLAVIHDVTQRKLVDEERERALDELHELAAALVHVQDDERRRIGRDLHDSTGQGLAALELSLSLLTRAVQPSSKPAQMLVYECVALARQCSSEIRTASYLLHPPLLDEIGLLSALRWLADGLRKRSGIDIKLEFPETMGRLPPEHELAIFRVAQEALTNVHRHSKSPSVTIRLFEQDDTVILEVEDAGRGMAVGGSPDRVADGVALGVGLAGMRERMRQLGGALSVRTSSEGTCLRASLSPTRTAGLRTDQPASL